MTAADLVFDFLKRFGVLVELSSEVLARGGLSDSMSIPVANSIQLLGADLINLHSEVDALESTPRLAR